MTFVVLIVIAATGIGMLSQRRFDAAPRVARGGLQAMLYLLLPFVSFVNIAHLRLTVGTGTGLLLAYPAIGLAGLTAWLLGRRLGLERRSLGAMIVVTIVVNTGYLGLPMATVLLGSSHLAAAVVYDQTVSGPILFVFAFAVGAAFGGTGEESRRERVRAFLIRNPPLLAVLAGLLAPASAAPESLVRASHVVVVALLPVGFFAVGVSLAGSSNGDARFSPARVGRAVAGAVAFRLLIAPIVMVTVSVSLVKLPSAYLLQAAMPTGINSLVVGHAYGLDERLIASAIVCSTAAVLIAGLVAGAI